LIWCEFSSGAVVVPPVLCWRKLQTAKTEVAMFKRMRVPTAEGTRAVELRREGEVKAGLARFWSEAVTAGEAMTRHATHPEVARAVAWLERHYANTDALEAFYLTVTLSPNHFRVLFKQQTGETVQEVLARLRLRRARYLVQETMLPMKQIAAETGFGDPLYFSAQYRRFWGRAATEDRRAGGVA
jgi:transcriptional regulator GlxA family with amidase domain